MAFIRNCVITAVTALCILLNAKAQTIYYPAGSSGMLKGTAEDAAALLQKAISGSQFIVKMYTTMPTEGIVFVYDTAITDNQACRVVSNGHNFIKFTAAEDNGLHFGLYKYFNQLGFRFYQPGAAWEIIPTLSTAYKNFDTVYNCNYKYKTWFISGGSNQWIMDKVTVNGWDIYAGENGHSWATYQRRNGMLGSSRFAGHQDAINTGATLTTLQNNPCYVANFNGSRVANTQSVPDIFNTNAKEFWANIIEQKYTQFKNSVYANPLLYVRSYRSFKYNYGSIGIEVPDGAKFGNSKENEICNITDYPKESDQHFILANYTVQKVQAKYPGKRFQLYAYSGHSDVPSPSISIDKSIDIQLIPTVYQMESSTNGLRNRWYNRSNNISEYHYLNLSAWSGETPSINWDDLKTTLQIAKDKKSQGIIWEASPAKFGSLPYLLAANNYLKENIEVDSTLHEFCNNMFAGANNTVYKILKMWGEENTAPNKYNVPVYLDLLSTATQQTNNAPAVVKERLRELKAYVHYMVMYFNLASDDQNKSIKKEDRDAAICIYLAKTNRMQLVNSYYIIANIVSKYAATSDFRIKYNLVNGTAYQNGNLPLITAVEIDANFADDVNKYTNKIDKSSYNEAGFVKQQFTAQNIVPLKVINTKLWYTNGLDNYNRATYNFIASQPGNFTIKYTPQFDTPGKGYINFTVEETGQKLQIVKDFSIDHTAPEGTLTVNVPKAGSYLLTVVSKYKSAVNLSITTNGIHFYKGKAFLGSTTESYKPDFASLPGYFYIPAGLDKVYCNVTNFNGVKYASPTAISNSFLVMDNNGNAVKLNLASAADSSLFYFDVPQGNNGIFYRFTAVAQYSLKFVNISNLLWYAKKNDCSNKGFSATLINKNGNCITRLSTAESISGLSWQINSNGQIFNYTNQAVIDLPQNISTDATITLTNNAGCSFTKQLANDHQYMQEKNACAGNNAGVANIAAAATMYPNPSAGVFNCMVNGRPANADEITIFNALGNKVSSFKNVRQFNLSGVTAGMYVYRMVVEGKIYNGKVVKL